jgi:hypothetical protein
VAGLTDVEPATFVLYMPVLLAPISVTTVLLTPHERAKSRTREVRMCALDLA